MTHALAEQRARERALYAQDPTRARERAEHLMTFAAGLDDAGHPELARRARLAAYDVFELVDKLRSEQSVRRELQRRNAELERIVLKAVYQEVIREERRQAARAK